MLIEVVSAGPGCSICQKALKLVKQAAAEFPQIEIRELHVVDQFERLQELNVFSAGAILINGKAEFSSLPALPKLRERVHELLHHEDLIRNKRRN
ncbi:thioredoxin family protein [Paenibacillus arenilitoris]|uniref:Thioredoxin family protein n=1 Tax=Paenibacillus arenilitoris TaxID=2772299 RepID=A0A927H8A4_9BACL|nr:thioredoxin family protein [Paenibacillus arenilitoris]MBD2871865.1 thioredoxin family protein [Paenibacillus arenilitoris]